MIRYRLTEFLAGRWRHLWRAFALDTWGAVPGPTSRTYGIDDHTPSLLTTWKIVGEPSGIGALEESLHDLTGPSDTSPVILPAGFTRGDDMKFTFQADVGGTPDPTTSFHVNRGTSRTITITFVSGWTFSSEAYVSKVEPKTSPEKLSLLDVTFKLTGAQTVT